MKKAVPVPMAAVESGLRQLDRAMCCRLVNAILAMRIELFLIERIWLFFNLLGNGVKYWENEEHFQI